MRPAKHEEGPAVRMLSWNVASLRTSLKQVGAGVNARMSLQLSMASGKVIERPQVVLFQDAQGISRLVEAEEADIVCLQVGASVDAHGRATGAIACCTLESCECEAGDKAEGQRCGGLRENPATNAAGVALLLEQLDSEEGLLRRGYTVQVCVSGFTLSSSEIH